MALHVRLARAAGQDRDGDEVAGVVAADDAPRRRSLRAELERAGVLQRLGTLT